MNFSADQGSSFNSTNSSAMMVEICLVSCGGCANHLARSVIWVSPSENDGGAHGGWVTRSAVFADLDR